MKIDNNKLTLYTKNNISYLKFKILEKYDNIEHGFSFDKNINFRTRDKFGNMYPENINNYKLFLNIFNLNYINTVKPIFKHSSNCKIVTKKYNQDKPDFNLDEYYNIDALITQKKDLILATTSADCNLIFIYDPINKIIANVHSGWLGTLNRVVVNTINTMIKKFKTNPNNLICCISPSIRVCHFEVDEDVYNRFKEKIPNEEYYKFINNKWHIDLVKIIIDDLIKLGINENNIIDSNICSVCNSNKMHSYRADKQKSGLNMGFICIKGEE